MSKVSKLFEDSKTSVANTKRLGYVGSDVRGTIDSRNDDWYTPKEWISFAHNVLGGIDLDPFSSVHANEIVKAKRIFTIDDDAFAQEWKARTVWMNPPYTRGVVDKAVSKFIEEFRKGNFIAGLMLINNMTDTQWYKQIYPDVHAFCNITGRLSFENASGQQVNGNTRGQTLALFANKTSETNQIKSRFTKFLAAKGQVECLVKRLGK